MTVSHIGLTVSHLPTSCSFFLATLQPLGYRFIGQWGNQIGLGVNEADFFLTQETPGIKAGAAHVAFSASSRAVVREFYACALRAGGRSHGSPAARLEGDECFNAAVLDFDGNSVEVVFHEGASADDAASYTGLSKALAWRNDVSAYLGDNKSTVSVSTLASTAKKALVPAASSISRSKATSVANSTTSKTTFKTRSEAPMIQRSFTAPVLSPQRSDDKMEISRKTLVGTILGAAAGAAVAYAMCKSEEDSARAEQAAYHAVQASTKQLQASHPELLDVAPVYSSPARSTRNASEADPYYDRGYPVRAIEAPPPPSYHHPAYTTFISPQQPEEPVSSPRSRISVSRSLTSPEGKQRSTILSSFSPSGIACETQKAEADHHSSHSERNSTHSRTKSHHSKSPKSSTSSRHSSSSKRTSRSKSRHRSSNRTPQPSLSRILEGESDKQTTPKRTSVLGRSVVDCSPYPSSSEAEDKTSAKGTSILGRSVAEYSPYPSEQVTTDNDTDTVVPSDSISQIGSRTQAIPRTRQNLQGATVRAAPQTITAPALARSTKKLDIKMRPKS